MTEFHPHQEDTLTARNITDSYSHAYKMVYGDYPDCQHLEGRWFLVDGVERERYWLIMEIDRLRKEALIIPLEKHNKSNNRTSSIFKMIRRLSRL